MDFWTGLYLVSFLNVACCLPESSYTVHLNKLSFRNALDYCKPGGFLSNIPNEKERAQILKAIWEKNNKDVTSFWIGLKKDKGACVQQFLPLKGFHWTVDNNTQSDVDMWKTVPSDTCTDVRCGLLSVEYGDSETKNSGLVDAACKQEHAFICKRNANLVCPRPQIFGTHDFIEHKDDPYKSQIVCASGARFNLTCSHDLEWTLVGNENTDILQLCLECKKGYRRDVSGNCADVNECEESNPCKHKCFNTEGSYKCVCADYSEEDCDVTKPPTTDEYRHINKGKFMLTHPTTQPDDVRTNETELQVEESAGDISNIIVPVIIALLIFIVLLVIIAAIVKGCLRRRTIKLGQRKAEAVALNGSNSMEKVNEKEET